MISLCFISLGYKITEGWLFKNALNIAEYLYQIRLCYSSSLLHWFSALILILVNLTVLFLFRKWQYRCSYRIKYNKIYFFYNFTIKFNLKPIKLQIASQMFYLLFNMQEQLGKIHATYIQRVVF